MVQVQVPGGSVHSTRKRSGTGRGLTSEVCPLCFFPLPIDPQLTKVKCSNHNHSFSKMRVKLPAKSLACKIAGKITFRAILPVKWT